MEEIKQEILSLSDKYSVKCVESAALEERLAAATAQLAHAHNHIMQLDARYIAYKVMGRPLRVLSWCIQTTMDRVPALGQLLS